MNHATNTADQKARAKEIVLQLDALYNSKRPGGGVHGQVIGMEQWVIRTTGDGLQCLYEAQSLLDELLDPFDRRATQASAEPVAWAVVAAGKIEHVSTSKESAEGWLPYVADRTLVPLCFAAPSSAPSTEPVAKGALDSFLAAADEAGITHLGGLASLYDAPERAPSIDSAGELARIKRVAACGTVQSFLALPDEDKANFFALAMDESERCKKAEARLEFLHSLNKDADGWEWGVARVRWNAEGRAEVLWALSDHSDIDAAAAMQPQGAGGQNG